MIHNFYEILKGVGLCSPFHKSHDSPIHRGLQSPGPLISPIILVSPEGDPVCEGCAWRMCFTRVLL